MRRQLRLTRALAAALSLMVASGVALLGTGQPAAADPTSWTNLRAYDWTYTDSATPATNIRAAAPDVPIGSWRDATGGAHTTRMYLVFDVRNYFDDAFHAAELVLDEASAASCPKRAVEIWETEYSSGPTWNNPPKTLGLLGTITDSAQCPATLSVVLSDAVRRAIDERRSFVSLMVRVPAANEADDQYARRFRFGDSFNPGVRLRLGWSSIPVVDNSKLYTNGRLCPDSTPPALRPISLGASMSEGSQEPFRADFAYWPVDDPSQRTVLSTTDVVNYGLTQVWLPEDAFTQGVTYGWAVQAVETDGEYRSAWSTTCTFVADFSGPATPLVTSSNYPAGGTAPIATPGSFTFAANGSASTVAYQYGWSKLNPPLPGDPYTGTGYARPAAAGGPVTLSLVPPAAGSNTLRVRACDQEWRCSAERLFTVTVPDTTPDLTVEGSVWVGLPFTVTAAPRAGVTGVTEYDFYPFYATTPTVVPAQPDGTATHQRVAPESQEYPYAAVARLANGWVTPKATTTMRPFYPAAISSTQYPKNTTAGGVGVPGTFTITRLTDQLTSAQYHFDGDAVTPVQFAPDGTATVTWTPTKSGRHSLVVEHVSSFGTFSVAVYQFTVA